MNISGYIHQLISMLKKADKAILDVYNSSFAVEDKADNSPITEADKASHNIIVETLSNLFPHIPIISEEGSLDEIAGILKAPNFWLVDPLDGTQEFVNRNGEFTICVALIENNKPVFGFISVPTKDTVYYGGKTISAHKKVGDQSEEPISVADNPTNIICVSRSHLSEKTQSYINENYPEANVVQVGSSLKATMLAEGLTDLYPVFDSRMNLWDLAASHAIIEAAGGRVERPNGDSIIYDAVDLKIGDFIARR